MEVGAIREAVEREIGRWIEDQGALNRPVELSPGARELLVTVIANIERDPSPAWMLRNADEAQGRAIAFIPVALSRVAERAYFGGKNGTPRLTTWEMLHESSNLVQMLCFIPKTHR